MSRFQNTLFTQTREELRNSLEEEIRGFNVDKDLSSNHVISWNHHEFEVQYHCLSEEIKIGKLCAACGVISMLHSSPVHVHKFSSNTSYIIIKGNAFLKIILYFSVKLRIVFSFHCKGDYYLRLLLEEDDNDEYSAIKRSYEFFNDLYHRFLLTPKTHMKCMCLQAMAIVYGRCYDEIGAFNDTKYIVGMLERVS